METKREIRVTTEFGKIYILGTCEGSDFISEGNFEDRIHIGQGLYATRTLFAGHYFETWHVDNITLKCHVIDTMIRNEKDILQIISTDYIAIDQDLSNEDYQILVNSSKKNDDYLKSIHKPTNAENEEMFAIKKGD